MDRKEAREVAHNWIERVFIDKLVSACEESDTEYNLATEMGFTRYEVDLDSCDMENFIFADELCISYEDISISFEKKSRNSGIVSFKLKNYIKEDMELVLELYENILQRHYLEKDLRYIRGGAWTRPLVNDGWFIYDSTGERFWFFTPGFNVSDRKIENEVGSFYLDVSLTRFDFIDKYRILAQLEEKYPSELDILKRFREEVLS